MKCNRFREYMLGAIYGELSPAKKSKLNLHIQDCSECSKEWASLQSTMNAVRNARSEIEPSHELDIPIMVAAREAVLTPAVKKFWFSYPLPALAAVSVCMIALFVLFTDRHESPGRFYQDINETKGGADRVEKVEISNATELEAVQEEAKEIGLNQPMQDLSHKPEVNNAVKEKPSEEPVPAKAAVAKADKDFRAVAPDMDFKLQYGFIDDEQEKVKGLGYVAAEKKSEEADVTRAESARKMMAAPGLPQATQSVKNPVLLTKIEPKMQGFDPDRYPAGGIMIEALISTSGNVEDVRIIKSLNALSDHMAVEAVKEWRFEPGVVNGIPREVKLSVTITFKKN